MGRANCSFASSFTGKHGAQAPGFMAAEAPGGELTIRLANHD
jgi:hypothetical protein